MHEQIKDIQNTIWKAYTDFQETKDMNKYNQDAYDIVYKYKDHEMLKNFATNLIISWCPVIHKVAIRGE